MYDPGEIFVISPDHVSRMGALVKHSVNMIFSMVKSSNLFRSFQLDNVRGIAGPQETVCFRGLRRIYLMRRNLTAHLRAGQVCRQVHRDEMGARRADSAS